MTTALQVIPLELLAVAPISLLATEVLSVGDRMNLWPTRATSAVQPPISSLTERADTMQVQELPQQVLARVDALDSLVDGWNSYGARAPTAAALEALRQSLLVIAAAATPLEPRIETLHVGPISGGAVIEWDVGARSLEVLFDEHGGIAALRFEGDEGDDESRPLGGQNDLVKEVRWLLG